MSERRYPLQVYEIREDKLVPSDDIHIWYFGGIKQLMQKSKKGMVNVVYFKNLHRWVDLLDRLKYNDAWQTCLLDEFEDICLMRASNKGEEKTWSKNELLAGSLKEMHKSRVSVMYTTHSGSQGPIETPSTSATGGGQPHENRLPFYNVAWIMRIK